MLTSQPRCELIVQRSAVSKCTIKETFDCTDDGKLWVTGGCRGMFGCGDENFVNERALH